MGEPLRQTGETRGGRQRGRVQSPGKEGDCLALACPPHRVPRSLPGVEGTVVGVGGCGDGDGGSGGSWSEGREVQSNEGLAWAPPTPRLVWPEGVPR